MNKTLSSLLTFLMICTVSPFSQAEMPSSGDPLIDNLRAVEVQIQELNADRRLAERFKLETKVEMRYGRQIAKGLEQSSATLVNRIESINAEFAKFGRTLESTEPLREAAARYRAYSRMMKFSGEPNNAFIQIEELATNAPAGKTDGRIRLTKNGRSVVELKPETLEFIRKSEILGPFQTKSNSGNSIREYDIVQPKSRMSEVAAPRIDLKTFEPDKDLTSAAAR